MDVSVNHLQSYSAPSCSLGQWGPLSREPRGSSVHFMYQCDQATGCPEICFNRIYVCVSEGISRGNGHLNKRTELRGSHSSMWEGLSQFTEGLSKTERQRKGALAPSAWLVSGVFTFSLTGTSSLRDCLSSEPELTAVSSALFCLWEVISQSNV